MLSYQHGYHAGNFADVHKHTALCLVLQHFANNKKIVTYIDSHAGRGIYDLSGEQANKTAEWKDGYKLVSKAEVSSHGLELYKNSIEFFQQNHTADIYPGSPALMHQAMADNHHSVFFELHPAECESLKENFGDDNRIKIVYKNAQAHLMDFLPGRKAEGLLLIDPSYEIKEEYFTIAKLANFTHKRWPTAVVMVWYPMLPEKRHEELKSKLRGATFYELTGPAKVRGMYGTGLAIYNVPDTFDETFSQAEDEMRKIIF